MIYGIGTDIVAVARLEAVWQRHGERALARILAPQEIADFTQSKSPGRFLAKRWAAKEALGKALGIGVRAPALLPAMAIAHDELGKPCFDPAPELAAYLAERRLRVHLSLSDEADYAVAYVILEQS